MEENKPKNTKLIAIITAIAVAVITLVVVLIIVLSGGGKKAGIAGLQGKWKYSDGVPYIYTFAAEGKGSYGYCADVYTAEECANYASDFTYVVHDGETKVYEDGEEEVPNKKVDGTIDFTYENTTSPMTLEYHIEGDKLIIYDSFGSPVEYDRMK